jgi:CDP-diacylglycerol--glycerol-3-phosphate 3-phosphatidyltransferase
MINFREDEELFIDLLKFYKNPESNLHKIRLATGYLNLQREFRDILVKNANLKTDILTSSPRANGFYKAGRFKKYIPGMYRVNELSILKEVKRKGTNHINIYEYENGEWTYHAKGAWVYEKN